MDSPVKPENDERRNALSLQNLLSLFYYPPPRRTGKVKPFSAFYQSESF